jgi:hypothetical protein
VTRRRPASVLATIWVLVFLGLSALAGGIGLTFGRWLTDSFPDDWLDRLPVVDSWLLPGLVLGIGFGLGSLVVAYGMFSRPRWPWLGIAERFTGHHWSWVATILIGAGQVVWILLELIYLGGVSPLHVVYGGVGVALVLMPLRSPVDGYLREPTRRALPGRRNAPWQLRRVRHDVR